MSKIIATGKHGFNYEFTLYSPSSYVPDDSGVYAFLKQDEVNSYSVIYIGETNSFYDRIYTNLEQHNAWPCISRNGVTHVGICPIQGNSQKRLDVETDLRHNYPTPCNLQ